MVRECCLAGLIAWGSVAPLKSQWAAGTRTGRGRQRDADNDGKHSSRNPNNRFALAGHRYPGAIGWGRCGE